jgi:phosphoserine aminotransferase
MRRSTSCSGPLRDPDLQLLRRPRRPAERSARTGRRRNARLAWQRHVRDGDEPPRSRIHLDLQAAVRDLRELLSIPDNYQVLFLQGGGLGENAIVPLNLLGPPNSRPPSTSSTPVPGRASRSRKRRATPTSTSRPLPSLATSPRCRRRNSWKLTRDAAYVHICTNETIDGVEYNFVPTVQGDTPLVADMSSHILSREIDVSKYGVIFAGAQKNIGPAGLTLVIVREDLLGTRCRSARPPSTGRPWPSTTRCTTRRRPTASISPAWCSPI